MSHQEPTSPTRTQMLALEHLENAFTAVRLGRPALVTIAGLTSSGRTTAVRMWYSRLLAREQYASALPSSLEGSSGWAIPWSAFKAGSIPFVWWNWRITAGSIRCHEAVGDLLRWKETLQEDSSTMANAIKGVLLSTVTTASGPLGVVATALSLADSVTTAVHAARQSPTRRYKQVGAALREDPAMLHWMPSLIASVTALSQIVPVVIAVDSATDLDPASCAFLSGLLATDGHVLVVLGCDIALLRLQVVSETGLGALLTQVNLARPGCATVAAVTRGGAEPLAPMRIGESRAATSASHVLDLLPVDVVAAVAAHALLGPLFIEQPTAVQLPPEIGAAALTAAHELGILATPDGERTLFLDPRVASALRLRQVADPDATVSIARNMAEAFACDLRDESFHELRLAERECTAANYFEAVSHLPEGQPVAEIGTLQQAMAIEAPDPTEIALLRERAVLDLGTRLLVRTRPVGSHSALAGAMRSYLRQADDVELVGLEEERLGLFRCQCLHRKHVDDNGPSEVARATWNFACLLESVGIRRAAYKHGVRALAEARSANAVGRIRLRNLGVSVGGIEPFPPLELFAMRSTLAYWAGEIASPQRSIARVQRLLRVALTAEAGHQVVQELRYRQVMWIAASGDYRTAARLMFELVKQLRDEGDDRSDRYLAYEVDLCSFYGAIGLNVEAIDRLNALIQESSLRPPSSRVARLKVLLGNLLGAPMNSEESRRRALSCFSSALTDLAQLDEPDFDTLVNARLSRAVLECDLAPGDESLAALETLLLDVAVIEGWRSERALRVRKRLGDALCESASPSRREEGLRVLTARVRDLEDQATGQSHGATGGSERALLARLDLALGLKNAHKYLLAIEELERIIPLLIAEFTFYGEFTVAARSQRVDAIVGAAGAGEVVFEVTDTYMQLAMQKVLTSSYVRLLAASATVSIAGGPAQPAPIPGALERRAIIDAMEVEVARQRPTPWLP